MPVRPAGVLLLLSCAAGASEPAASPARTDYFPMVRGSTWTYATDAPQGDFVVDALYTEKTACRDPHAHDHAHDDGGKPADAEHEHLVFALSVAPRDGSRQVSLQREWYRRDEAGDLRCGRRSLNQEEVFFDPPQLVLPADPKGRKEWTWTGAMGHDSAKVRSAVTAEETVRVPAGTFAALRVQIETETLRCKGRATRWYAPGVGLVKEETEIEVKHGKPVRTRSELSSYRIGPPPDEPESGGKGGA